MSEIGYVAYIDEAGDFGLKKIAPIDKHGASEWLMVSGVVIRARNEPNINKWLRAVRVDAKNTQPVDLHFRTLTDRQKRIICKAVADMDVRLFIAISNKQNMRQHRNERAATVSNTRAWFYWWMCRLLLERITEFCEAMNKRRNTPNRKVRIEFSRRKDLTYTELTDYLTLLWMQKGSAFLNKKNIHWSVMDLKEIYAFDHRTRAGLQFADIVASAFYQSVNRDNKAICNPEFAKLLRPRVWVGPNGNWFDSGFKVFPVPLKFPNLSEQQKEIFRYYGYPNNKW